tara:strand:+ start:140 stop:397 length:258 start_codon:yes stop_codon:yes gene_type:complete
MENIKYHTSKPSPKIERTLKVINAQKKYYASNREVRNRYTKNYHATWNTEVKRCSCGLDIKNYSYVKHLKSKKHLKRLNELNKIE